MRRINFFNRVLPAFYAPLLQRADSQDEAASTRAAHNIHAEPRAMRPEEVPGAPHENTSETARHNMRRIASSNGAASVASAIIDATPSLNATPRDAILATREYSRQGAGIRETTSRADFLRENAPPLSSDSNSSRASESAFASTRATSPAEIASGESRTPNAENTILSDTDSNGKASFGIAPQSKTASKSSAFVATETKPRDSGATGSQAAPAAKPSASHELRVLASAPFATLLGAFFAPCVLLLALLAAWHPLAGGDDVWAHAAIGSWMWDRGEIPRESLFLWGAPPIDWVWHSWLSQFTFYGLMRLGETFRADGGPYAIATFTMLGVGLCFVLLWKLWRRNAPPGSACALMFGAAIFAGTVRYRPRPELFTALFLVLLMLWLDAWWREYAQREEAETSRASTRGVVWRVILLCAMFALWSNFHGAVLLGLVLLFATAFFDVWQSRADRKSFGLCIVALLCAVSTLCNPFGARVLLDSLHSANSGMFSRIDEWKPPLHEVQLLDFIWCEIALVAMATTSWWRNPHRRLAHAAWLLIFFAMFLMQRRHLWLLALVCLAVGAMNARYLDFGVVWQFLRRFVRKVESAPPPFLRVLWRGAILLGLACNIGGALRVSRFNSLAPHAVNALPAGAAAFVEAQKLRGRVYNDYENSSYLQWAWNGKNPLPREAGAHAVGQARRALYIDLLNAYPPALLEEYLTIWAGGDTAQKLFDKRKIDIVILGDDKRDHAFTKWMNANAKWRRLYDRKGDGLVWIRVKAAPQSSASTRGQKHLVAAPK